MSNGILSKIKNMLTEEEDYYDDDDEMEAEVDKRPKKIIKKRN